MFLLADRPGRDTLTRNTGMILDPQITPSTFSVVTTPVPSIAIALAGAAAVAMLIRRPRGRGETAGGRAIERVLNSPDDPGVQLEWQEIRTPAM